jgi:hypothetical protein
MTRLDLHAPAGRARRHPIQPPAHRREVSEMNATRIQMAVHADRAARFAAEAHEARNARAARRAAPADERRIRRAIGRSLVRIGARIAAEPGAERLQPAGSR